MSENSHKTSGKKKPKKKSKLRGLKKFFAVIGTMLLSLFLIVVLTGTIVTTALTVYVLEFMEDTNEISIHDLDTKYSTFIYANDPDSGNLLELYHVEAENKRIPVSIDRIPEHTRNAFVYAEDERFYSHEGVDYKRTFAAFANMFLHFYSSNQGGSTITQQLVKNITGDNEQTAERKIREIFRAMQLEKKYPKNEILEAYLNYIGFGGTANGIQMAAKKYFGKDVSELTIAESACLAAIPKSPETLNPFAGVDKNGKTGAQRNEERYKNYILKNMYDNGVISTTEYHEALNEKLIFTNSEEYKALHPEEFVEKTEEEKQQEEENKITSYIVDAAIYELSEYFEETENITQQEAISKINKGGYKIYTTVDLNLQEYLENKYSSIYNFPGIYSELWIDKNKDGQYQDNEMELPQSGIIVEGYDGSVLGLVGGIGEKTTSLSFNRAVKAKRQPGSCIKPITSYGAALSSNAITWSSIFNDAPVLQLADGKWWPNNYEENGYWSHAPWYVVNALKMSRNTIPAQICHNLGLQAVYDFATEKLHVDLAEKDLDYSPLAVGGLTNGLTLKNLANSYIPYGNGGTYYKAHVISKVENADGSVLFDYAEIPGEQAVDSQTATVMNKLLQEVVNSGTATAVKNYVWNTTVAGKTGTTQDYHDVLFVGLTPDFVSAFWLGYDTPYDLQQMGVNQNTGQLWGSIMGDYINNMNTGKQFPVDPNVIEASYCAYSGNLANGNCPYGGTGYYKSDNAPYCWVH